MDPQHIPHEFCSDPLAKARALGLNTIFSYVFWDQLEPTQGSWDNTGNNDIAKYFRLVQEHGLNVILRPGPYVCAEHEWGGFPAWLSGVPDMVVRSNNKPFLDASRSFTDRLAKDLNLLQVTNGGPILMVQIENEYGYWIAGPQQSLYLPGCYLRKSNNKITILFLELTGDEKPARGITTRK